MEGQKGKVMEVDLTQTIAATAAAVNRIGPMVEENTERLDFYMSCIVTFQQALRQLLADNKKRDEEIAGMKQYITKKFGYKFKTQDDEEIPF